MNLDKIVEFLKNILAVFFACTAVVTLSRGVYLICFGQSAAVGPLLVVSLVATLLFYFPQLELLKAFGVEAKVKKSIDDAKEVIKILRKQAESAAKATYALVAYSNRYEGLTPQGKQQIIDDTDDVLESLGTSKEDVRNLKGPYLASVGYDLKDVFESILKSYIQCSELDIEGRKKWLSDLDDGGWLQLERIKEMKGQQLGAALVRSIPTMITESESRSQFEQLGRKLGQIFADCLNRGGYTEESLAFLEKGRDALNPSSVPTKGNVVSALNRLLEAQA
jgi:hypothetical protein